MFPRLDCVQIDSLSMRGFGGLAGVGVGVGKSHFETTETSEKVTEPVVGL